MCNKYKLVFIHAIFALFATLLSGILYCINSSILLFILILVVCIICILKWPYIVWILILTLPLVKAWLIISLPRLQIIDYTFFICILAGLVGILNYLVQPDKQLLKFPWIEFLCLLFIGIFMFISLNWTSAPQYGFKKLFHFIGIGIPYFVLPFLFIRSKDDAIKILKMIILSAIIVSIGSIISPSTEASRINFGSGYNRATFLAGTPNLMALVVSYGLLTSILLVVLKYNIYRKNRFILYFLTPVFILSILMSGSRAAFIGIIVMIYFIPLLINKKSKFRSIFFSYGIIPLIIIIFFVLKVKTIPLERFLSTNEYDMLTSNSRLTLWSFCFKQLPSAPLHGYGVGSFAVNWAGIDDDIWPHNIFIEAQYELGILGLLALVLFIILTLTKGIHVISLCMDQKDRALIGAPLLLIGFMIIIGMFDPDLNGIRPLYLFCGLLFANIVQVIKQ